MVEGDSMNWTFAINRDSYFEIRDNDEIKWSSAKEVKKGNIVCVYTGRPYSEIGFIFKAKTDLFEDEQIRRDWNKSAILVDNKIIIKNPITIKELRENSILGKWGAVRRNFMGSHFKMSDEEWNELKRLILEKNPELKNEIENLEKEDEAGSNGDYGNVDFYDLNAGRAHIVRDICYLISQKGNISENDLFELLRGNVSDDSYWKAYFQRSNKNNSQKYNLNAARTLNLVFKNKLELTNLGEKLVNAVTPEELFNYNYGIEVKKFFYNMALENYPIRTAMNILKEKGKLRFYAPLCDRTNKVMWKHKETEDGFICEQDGHPECNDCDRDLLAHIKESSLPFETFKETKRIEEGSVFWMCSRVTPMHLTGSEPSYSGNYIYWDEKAEKELDEIDEDACKPVNIIKTLYKEFENGFYSSGESVDHSKGYNRERQNVKKYYELIGNDPEAKFNTQDPPINHLLPIKKPAVAPVAVGDIRAFGYKDEDLPGLTEAVYSLLKNLIETNDKIEQQKLINTFKSGPYKKGFQTAMLTPVLYYLNPDFLFINKKTVSSYRFISKILGKDENISGNLVDYIDNNEKLKDLIKTLKSHIQDLNFENFDTFCHWLCSKGLGNYAEDTEKYDEWLLNHCPPIRNSLELILNNYNLAKDGNEKSQEYIRNALNRTLPDYLDKKTNNSYHIYSSGKDEWRYCPYVALMDDRVTNKPTKGFYINYMFREDMGGVYLALRQGVTELKNKYGIEGLEILKSRAATYRKILNNSTNLVDRFSDSIDLKKKDAEFATFYEASNICSKLYFKDRLPSEKEMESDLKDILELYNMLLNGEPENFLEFLNEKGFYFEPELIENFLLSLKVKPFVILTGNSGTGKTKTAQLFAQYLDKGENPTEDNYRIVPVGANWTENRHIVGFFNVITEKYQRTEALDLIISSQNDSINPHFLILDEMNLSHVERYFSDFLSAMESEEAIQLHLSKDIEDVPTEITFSDNLFVIGTVNVDETTYMFSPKVLDRSNTIEFLTPSAKGYLNGDKISYSINGDINYLENPLSDIEIRTASLSELKELFRDLNISKGSFWDLIANELEEFQKVLKKVRFDFGFRVINEIMRFMYVSWVYEGRPSKWDNWQRYFDAQIKQKMLPRIHGSQRTLENALDDLAKLCENYPTSKIKLEEMNEMLKKQRYVSFTN